MSTLTGCGLLGGDKTAVIMTGSHSQLSSIKDLAGKTVAVTARGTLADLMVKSAFATNGGDPSTLERAEMPFTDMTAALGRGQVDAATMVEPFVTAAQKSTGATILADLATGPLNDLPFTAYAGTAKFVDANPKTVQAFQKAMQRATNDAADRTKIEPPLPSVRQGRPADGGTHEPARLPLDPGRHPYPARRRPDDPVRRAPRPVRRATDVAPAAGELARQPHRSRRLGAPAFQRWHCRGQA